MPQQINLCLPLLRKKKDRFAAQTLAQMLGILLLAGAAASAVWSWNLQRASAVLTTTLTAQDKELVALRAAQERAKASTGPAQAALLQELAQHKLLLQQREQLLLALNQGRFQPGRGHSDRLRLVAQSIPSVAWVTHIRADEQLLEVGGYTLEPAVLNDWVGQLGSSALLAGQALSTIKVDSVKPDAALFNSALLSPPAAPQAGGPAWPALWSFSLLSRMAQSKMAIPASQVASSPAVAASGGKP